MGRPPLDEKTKRDLMQKLIRSTQEIVLAEGVEGVTIRRIAELAEVNSAALYRFFKDLDELMVFSCLDYFRDYCLELDRQIKEGEALDSEKIYYVSWELFARYAFRQPEVTKLLFFSKYSASLKEIIEKYFRMSPELIAGVNEEIRIMLETAELLARNREVLYPFLQRRMSEESISLVNELTVSYFYMLLCQEDEAREKKEERMLRACHFLVEQYQGQ